MIQLLRETIDVVTDYPQRRFGRYDALCIISELEVGR